MLQTFVGGLGLVGLLVVIVTPIFPLSLESTSAFLSFESTSAFLLRSIRAKSGILSSLLELLEFSFSGGLTTGADVLDEVSSVPTKYCKIQFCGNYVLLWLIASK